jgi:hypothetical protein
MSCYSQTCTIKVQLTRLLQTTHLHPENSPGPLSRGLPHTRVSYISQPLQVFYFENSVYKQLKLYAASKGISPPLLSTENTQECSFGEEFWRKDSMKTIETGN